MSTLFNAIICRYHEIAIKGENRNMFERIMVENLQYLLHEIPDFQVKRVRGRIWVQHKTMTPFNDDEMEIVRRQMVKAFGLQSYSPVIFCAADMTAIRQAVDTSCRSYFDAALAQHQTVSFRIRAKRSDKTFPLRSQQVEIELATMISDIYGAEKLELDLNHGTITVGCEIRDEFAFIYYASYPCPGGLPVGSNSPVLALLSGGIDSPVACYLLMKRGCHVDFLSFHSDPYTPAATVDKIKRMAHKLNEFQHPGRLCLCNLAPIQKLIRDCCSPEYRTVLYRQMMFRIAEKVAVRHHDLALLTGESVGQVASQTVINMNTINAVVKMVVLRPLVGNDKLENIALAEKIGTLTLSNEQVPDSCTVFAPPSPSTAASIAKIELEEAKLADWPQVLEQIILNIEEIRIP